MCISRNKLFLFLPTHPYVLKDLVVSQIMTFLYSALLGDLASGGDGGNGTATISTKAIFDREKQKYYYIPIVMWDMRGKNSNKAMTGTNTLTVTIADINDNIPKPGHQDIFVYNYKGEVSLTWQNLGEEQTRGGLTAVGYRCKTSPCPCACAGFQIQILLFKRNKHVSMLLKIHFCSNVK